MSEIVNIDAVASLKYHPRPHPLETVNLIALLESACLLSTNSLKVLGNVSGSYGNSALTRGTVTPLLSLKHAVTCTAMYGFF